MNDLVNLSAAQLALLGTLIVGVNELFTRLRAKDLWVAATIVSAAVLGGLVGLYYHVDFVAGVAAGFSSAGALTAVSHIGNKTTASVSTLLRK